MKRRKEKMEWYDGWINMVEEQFEVVRITQDLIKDNIEAAELLLTRHNFIYVLPGVFVDEALEKFFGQARQRSGAYKLFGKCNLHCCRAHLSHALRRIDSSMIVIQGACLTLSNILLKAFVLDNSDKERQLGRLKRKEKLSTKN
ncbi:unnamed protein product [Clavelina lepadiformis]|uniref:Uncharacterized protein n=1 Tax=Clavelina lepadiformis TaxID=159417 RepID=A0ABP0G9A7_CLALP